MTAGEVRAAEAIADDPAPIDILTLGPGTNVEAGRVGGKAANLLALCRAGFPVPAGFIVPAGEHERFLAGNGLKDRIARRLEGADFEDGASVAAASRDIKSFITGADAGAWPGAALALLLGASGGGRWAVRSSALAEDTADASFAGQQDTYLNVAPADVPAAVQRCWASYWNERAIAYRHAAGVPQLEGGVAVVVQRMVDAVAAGVLFTVDPMNLSDHVVVEACWGLGESLVSGAVVPDRFICDRGGNVLESHLSRKATGLFASSQAEAIDADRQREPALGPEQIKELVSLGLKAEGCFGGPQDIEWAVDGEGIKLLQSRPITALNDDRDTLWTRAYGDEYWADVTSPLFFSLLGEQLSKYVLDEGNQIMGYRDLRGKKLLKLHKGHIYFNAAVLEAIFTYNPKFSRTRELLNYFPAQDQPRVAGARTKLFRRALAEVRIALLDPDGMITRTDRAYRQWAKEFLEQMEEFDAVDLRGLSDGQLREKYDELYSAVLKHYRLIRYGMVTHSIATNLILKQWLESWLGDRSGALYAQLIAGLPDNKTIETNAAVARLAAAAREDPAAAGPLLSLGSREFLGRLRGDPACAGFAAQLDQFLARYGHRSHTREIFFPRWADDPALVVDALRSLAAAPVDLESLERQRIAARRAAEADALGRIGRLSFGWERKMAFAQVMKLAQTYLVFRENQRFYLDHQLLRFRRLFLEYGRRLAGRGVLERPEDVFFLSKEEVFQAMAGERAAVPKIPGRRRDFFRYADVLPPKFLKGSREFDDTVAWGQDAVKIAGTAASPGVARGRVRVVESIAELASVAAGEVLVASNTDPGWTPAFAKISALITETGGILSHGAVVSREYGIPAVTAVRGARRALRNGQVVTVDGNDGIIYTEDTHGS